MINDEMIKLGAILGGGLLIMLIGIAIQKRKKSKKLAEENTMMSGNSNSSSPTPSSSGLSPEEEKAKTYIEQYKKDYPRESLRSGLIGNGNSESDVDSWLDKYM
ncbi:MAG: hypothetical protein KC589_08645 [Nanoarchaeota archaeon]|nr:hypothetical protein [Nanoarchaeota archaeon]